MRYLLRIELEEQVRNLLLLSLGLFLTLLFSNLAWAGYVYLAQEPLLTELIMVKDGKDYVELYLSPEDCYHAGLQITGPVYWRCEFQ
jgi:hypothetical protein